MHSSQGLLVHLCANGKVCPCRWRFESVLPVSALLFSNTVAGEQLLKTAPVRTSPSLWLQRISCLKGSKRNHSATTEPTSLSLPPPCFCSYLFNNIKPKSTPLNAISSLTLKHFSKVDWALQFLQMD